MRKLSLIILVLCILLSSCSTIKKNINNESFKNENQPIRTIRVALFLDKNYINNINKVKQLIYEVSNDLQEQVGIKLIIIYDLVDITITTNNIGIILETMYEYERDRKQEDNFDISICFMNKKPIYRIMDSLIGGWKAGTDNLYRRYIVMSNLDKHALMHEIGHCFILDHEHSTSGVMQPFGITIIPGMPIYTSSYFSERDRKEILKNKWRNFNTKVNISGDYYDIKKQSIPEEPKNIFKN